MTVKDLIDVLQHCNPDLPVVCESSETHRQAWPAESAVFARRARTEFADLFNVSSLDGEQCVLIRSVPPDFDDDE